MGYRKALSCCSCCGVGGDSDSCGCNGDDCDDGDCDGGDGGGGGGADDGGGGMDGD